MTPASTALLDRINDPSDLRRLSEAQLAQLAQELRQETVRVVSITGGHLGASLGVIELTLALHYVFDTPRDKLIWDVGHQAYPHKILTGRRNRMLTLRQGDGLSGFTKRSESEYDPFGAAHTSTSISAALGMAVARDFRGDHNNVIAVIGDGAMSAGMAYEAMNNAGAMQSRLIVILNDNDMSIAPPVGAMSAYLSRLISSKPYRSLRHVLGDVAKKFPRGLGKAAHKVEEYARGLVTGGTLFEELGFFYVGPIDGHNFDHLLPVLKNLRDDREPGPVLVHVVTKKGHGYPPAERSADKYHGVGRFDVVTGEQVKVKANAPSYTETFAKALIQEAAKDEKIVAITAAMPAGTGLDKFAAKFPERCFDVGIAEQHAVTSAAGMAMAGLHPVVANDHLEVLRLLVERRRRIGEEHVTKVCQLHQILLELIPGGAKKDLSAAQARRLLDDVDRGEVGRRSAGVARAGAVDPAGRRSSFRHRLLRERSRASERRVSTSSTKSPASSNRR